jgi:3'-phosphoadenosine 5'-phosphosulfate sulfotransferase (PAPS reductase)/FAD synthetase
MRTLCWFSCGAASAVASNIILKENPDAEIIYTDPGAEHPDNLRFIKDCEKWFGKEIKILKSEKYSDIWDVFEKTRYLAGVYGARCTKELKKQVREDYQQYGDIHVFGFTADEGMRHKRFGAQNKVEYRSPLIELGITKQMCFDMIKCAGIELPMMYRLGYRNNNCIGCVKGQLGYWNKIRKDFPEVFDRMAKVEREIGAAINKSYAGDGKRKRIFLDELDPTMGKYDSEPSISCGAVCEIDLSQYDGDDK